MLSTPGIPFSVDEISVLSEPAEFYDRLIENIRAAQREIYLTSLYIGNGEKESTLYKELELFLDRGGRATVVVDWNRGQRGGKRSTFSLLKQILKKHPDALSVKVSTI